MGIKKYIRTHEKLMQILSVFYNFFMLNRVSGKAGVSIFCKGAFLYHCKIINHGSRNTVRVEKGMPDEKLYHPIFGNGNTIKISNDCEGNEMDFWISDGSTVEIGQHSHFVGKIHIAATEGKRVQIGEQCLFSSEVTIRTGDSHSILNGQRERINPAKDVKIGDHAWVGNQVVILKGTSIGNDCVVGTRSLITGKGFKDNVIIAGSPAKIIKQGITWRPELM